MTLPQFSRELIRPKLDEEVDKEIWQPDWRCFCCHDTGLIQRYLVELVINDYDPWNDKPVACQNSICEAGWNYRGMAGCDQRFERGVCAELHQIGREDWRQFVREQFENAKQRNARFEANTLAAAMTMPGSRGRNANDEREIEIRKEEIENIAQEDW